jgi:pyrroloquinoline quinone biosynthesis protein A
MCYVCAVTVNICSILIRLLRLGPAQPTVWWHPALKWHGYCVCPHDCTVRPARSRSAHHTEETTMTWTKPSFIDWRFGFEITLYVANR